MNDLNPPAEREVICADHAPVQHRDGKRPWCENCGRTVEGVHRRDLPGLSRPKPGTKTVLYADQLPEARRG